MIVITIAVALTLLPLLCFKYYNFILESGTSVLAFIGLDTPAHGVNWVLPLGLSFYTFQALGYLWDVYYGNIQAERNFADYMLFVAFFPQILCGPINNALSLLPQIKNPAPFDYNRAVSGLKYILWGMFLKVVLADRLGIYVDTIYSNYEHYSGTSCLISAIFYSFQIYGDFAGYSFMAFGVSRLLGYEIIKNFNHPYLATSVSMFWKRWNISLTRWLTKYIFIPLGGSRRGKGRNYRNIIITFLVSGIWHGANYTYIFWGLIHGIAQCLEKFFGLNKQSEMRAWIRVLRIVVTFIIVTIAWVFFRMPTISDGFGVIGHFFTFGSPFVDPLTMTHGLFALIIVIAVELILEYRDSWFRSFLGRHIVIRWTGYLFLTLSLLLFGVLNSGQFIYVSF